MKNSDSFILNFRVILLFIAISSCSVLQATESTLSIDSIIVFNDACDFSSGEVIIYATGTSELFYSINGGADYSSDNHFKDLAEGDYLVIVRDDSGCSEISTVQLLPEPNTEAPTIICPQRLELECGTSDASEQILQWIKNAYAEDFRARKIEVKGVLNPDSVVVSSCQALVEYDLIATDYCGKESNCKAEIFITDNTVPVVLCPTDLSVNVEDGGWPDEIELWMGTIQQSDNCSDKLKTTHDLDVSKVLSNCDPYFIEQVEFVASDECDNISICNSRIHFENELAPVVVCNEPLQVSCDDDLEEVLDRFLIQFEDLNAFDEDISVVDDSNIQDLLDIQCGEEIVIYFSVVDCCMRTADCSSIIRVEDDVSPNFTHCPENLIIPLLDDDTEIAIISWLDSALAQDNCSGVEIMNDHDVGLLEDLCGLNDIVSVDFTISDFCGNIGSSCRSSYFIEPHLVTIECPEPVSFECSEWNEEAVNNWMQNSRALVNGTHTLQVNNDFIFHEVNHTCGSNVIVEFTATDTCEEIYECESTITFIDNVSPSIFCPEDITIEFSEENGQEIISDWMSTVVAEDDCEVALIVNPDIIFDELACNEEVVVLFFASDACSNNSSCEALLFVSAQVPAVIDCPERLTYECGEDELEERIISDLDLVIYDKSELSYSIDLNDLRSNCAVEKVIEVTFSSLVECGERSYCYTELLIIPELNIYVPNTISLTTNNAEDRIFGLFGNSVAAKIWNMEIYDRWGNQVWVSDSVVLNDSSTAWAPESGMSSGIYLYKLWSEDSISDIEMSGQLTVMP